jgi:DNA-directed RNA polymerase subunit RPC12/RpoP
MKRVAAPIQAGQISAGVICVTVRDVGDMQFDTNDNTLKVMTPDGKVYMHPSVLDNLPDRVFDMDISYPCSHCGRDLLTNKPDHTRCDGCGSPLHRVKPVVSGGRRKH